jgi:hypothetical protein
MTISKKSTALLKAFLQRIGFRKSATAAPAIVTAVILDKPTSADQGPAGSAPLRLPRAAALETGPANGPGAPAQRVESGETARPPAAQTQPDIDFMGMGNLAETAQTLSVPIETLEKWVGAGILSPGETTVAQRLIRILRDRDRRRLH